MRRHYLNLLMRLLSLLMLSACQQPSGETIPPRTPLDFDTDPRILRGVWSGVDSSGNTLRLALRAGPTSEDGFYEINGIFELNDDAPNAFHGSVATKTTPSTGPYAQALTPQLSPPRCGPINAFAEFGAWQFCGTAPEGSPPSFDLGLEGEGGSFIFTLTRIPDATELPKDEDAPIKTDAERYAPTVGDQIAGYTVRTTYTNTSGESVYLVPCGFEPPLFTLERLEAGIWHTVFGGGPCPAVGGVPDTEVKPGESFSATLDLSASVPAPSTPLFGVELIPGVHRLRFVIIKSPRQGNGDEPGLDDLLPEEQRVSNAFWHEAP